MSRSAERITLEDVLDRASRGLWQVWAGYEGDDLQAVVVTELAVYPSGKKVASILLLAGEGVRRWAHRIDAIEAWARAEGCDAVEIQGRRGWGRIYPDYRPIFTTFEKELCHE